ncbi:hypothetical protein Dsin_025964 [Dipteronia sinensis]|uniref:Uncharacterized protein n=1 Tax=Dipteronia sinensis TaxID=43782 RepID=A0AAD9ZXX4_9ROSI|nr:hypothetical protein Dsin_025964 [Dipteronia sinensis]
MIYRKWSLLTGPMVILGGIVGTVVIASHLIVEHHPYFKNDQKKPNAAPSNK